jgi:hypothetical protein
MAAAADQSKRQHGAMTRLNNHEIVKGIALH